MIELLYINKIITFRNSEYEFHSVEKLDDVHVNIFMGSQCTCFIGGETTINGTLMNDSDDFIDFFNNN